MNVSMEDKKVEAIKRLKMMNLHPNVATDFEDKGLINFSEPPIGGLFWAKDDDLERIRAFEKEYNALVYAGIRSFTNIGNMDSYLFVGDYPEEWEIDRQGIENGEVLAYVYNRTDPDCSELGYIGITTLISGGLRRTW